MKQQTLTGYRKANREVRNNGAQMWVLLWVPSHSILYVHYSSAENAQK